MIDELLRNFSYALRTLRMHPAFSLTVIVTLALGIGGVTAMYSLIHQTILAEVAVPAPDELVSLRSPGLKPGSTRGDLAVGSGDLQFSFPMYRDLEVAQNVFTGIAAHYAFPANLKSGEQTTLHDAVLVSGNYFSTLRLRPVLGRLIDPEDAPGVGESRVVVLGYRYWQNQYGGDPGVIGQTLTVNNQPLTIIGVAPEGFSGTMRGWGPQVFVPLTLRWLMQPEEPRNDEDRQAYWVTLFARLKPGVSMAAAESEINAFYRGVLRDVEAPNLLGLSAQQRAQFLEGSVVLDPGARGQEYVEVRLTDPLTLALGATGLVLLIACVNVANLLLARGAARSGEMAIRASIGASRWRLLTQLLTESVVLAAAGGLSSLPVASATLRSIAALVPDDIARQFAVELSPPVLLFAAAITLATVLLFGLAPALSAGRANPGGVIKEQSAQSPGGRGLTRLRDGLVVVQIALSLVLLALSGLFTKSMVNVAHIDYGMDVDSLVAFNVAPLLAGYSGERLDTFLKRTREELAAQPGIASVAYVAFPMLYGMASGADVTVAGKEGTAGDNITQTNPMASPGFFRTVSIPLRAGRDFTDADSIPEPAVVIVNESFVRKFDLGAGAVGAVLRLDGPFMPQGPVEIIGVVADAKYADIKDAARPQVFTPRPPFDAQFPGLFFYVRGSIDADSLAAMIPEAIERIDPNVPVSAVTTLRRHIDTYTAQDGFLSLLSATFAGLATVLAAIGLYAVLAFNVVSRKREFGLRLALGAKPAALRKLVLIQVARLTAIGGAIGLVAALALGRVAQSLLFGLTAYDPIVLTMAVLALVVFMLGGSWLPARKAAAVMPMEALRYE
ncbi:MAG: ABC transporter permease [Gammaproteobacteria bacterium]|nr:MAG: ABC transporter permease [Gammaproteobacteria bacterium]